MPTDPTNAIREARRRLEDNRRRLGEEHPDSLAAMASLADAQRQAGELDAARQTFEDLLAIRYRVIDPEDYATLRIRLQLSAVLQALGELQQARTVQEDVLGKLDRIYGPDSDVSIVAGQHLANTLRAQRDYGALIPLEERLVNVRWRNQGEMDLETLRAVTSLASTLRSQGDFASAKEWDSLVLEVSQRNQLDPHVTISAQLNLLKDVSLLGDQQLRSQLLGALTEAVKRDLPRKDPMRREVEQNLKQLKTLMRSTRDD